MKPKPHILFTFIVWCACLISLSAQDADTYALTITPPANGTISVSPEMESYPEGTEITLTGTPNEGFRFIDWAVVGNGGDDENARGGIFPGNSHSFVINRDTTVRAYFAGAISENTYYDNLAVRGGDPNGSGANLKITFERFSPYQDHPLQAAQRFQAGDSGSVTAVEIGMARLGEPGGRLIVSVCQVDEASAEPGETVGTLGVIDGNTVPQINWCALPLKLDMIRVEGLVEGLEAGKEYFLRVDEDPNDLPQTSAAKSCGAPSTTLVIDMVDWTREIDAGESSLTTFDWPDPEVNLAPETWATTDRWWPFFRNLTMRFRIEGTPQQETEVHFDNLDDPGNPIPGDPNTLGHRIFGPDSAGGAAAQKFSVEETGNITSITMGLARLGEPGGKLVLSIHQVGDANLPGEPVATFAEVEINSLPLIVWANRPPKLERVTVEGDVSGLAPGDYFLVLTDQDAITDQSRGWIATAVQTPVDGDPVLADWGSGGWLRPWGDYFLHARIEGTATLEPPSDPFIIAKTEDGIVTKVPDLDAYPIGNTVTVTATPEPGFEFVKWQYGDQEFTTNPAEIIVAEGLTLTPRFAPVQPEPIDVEILPAMAIRWESEAGQSYEVQSSPDLQNWMTENANVEGTGETMTHFFIRDAREMYYRVFENQ